MSKSDRRIAEAANLQCMQIGDVRGVHFHGIKGPSFPINTSESEFLKYFVPPKILSMLDRHDSDSCEIAALEKRVEELEGRSQQVLNVLSYVVPQAPETIDRMIAAIEGILTGVITEESLKTDPEESEQLVDEHRRQQKTLEGEVVRLRNRTHEIQERADKKHARLEKQLGDSVVEIRPGIVGNCEKGPVGYSLPELETNSIMLNDDVTLLVTTDWGNTRIKINDDEFEVSPTVLVHRSKEDIAFALNQIVRPKGYHVTHQYRILDKGTRNERIETYYEVGKVPVYDKDDDAPSCSNCKF